MGMRTQWRVGVSGCTGLDYSALPEMWRRFRVAPDERDDIFADLQTMELAALDAMHTKDDE